MHQRSDLEELVYDKNWFYLFPNFRGANKHPAACGSQFAQQDIIDAFGIRTRKIRFGSQSRLFIRNIGRRPHDHVDGWEVLRKVARRLFMGGD